jgi:hypothetical protein
MAGLLDLFTGNSGGGLLGGGAISDALSPGRALQRQEMYRKALIAKHLEQSMGLDRQKFELDRQRFEHERNQQPPNVKAAVAAGLPLGSKEMQEALFPRTSAEPEKVRQLRAAGIDPTSPQGQRFLLGREHNPTELRAVHAAQDELPALQGTVEALDRALELNDKTYTGFGADLYGRIGTGAAGSLGMKPSPQASATVEWGKIMGAESIKNMAETLKGATTNQEMNRFVDLLSDPTTPPEIRKNIISRMRTLADRQLQIKQQRLKELRGYDPTEAMRGSQQPRQTPSDGWSVQRLD